MARHFYLYSVMQSVLKIRNLENVHYIAHKLLLNDKSLET